MFNEEKFVVVAPGYTFLGVLHLTDEQMAALTAPKGKRGKRRAKRSQRSRRNR